MVKVSASWAGRAHKYKAKRTQVDGVSFPSLAESRRYAVLKLLERAGEISNLELQPSFPIDIGGRHICLYKADFAYFKDGQRITEDVKGVRTPVYNLKKKLVEALYPGTKIIEIKA